MSTRVIPAARALTDFHPSAATAVPRRDAGDEPGIRQQMDEAVRRAREEGMAAGRQAAQQEFARQREALRRTHEQELQRCEEHWQLQVGQRLAARLDDGLRALEEALGERLALLLSPMLAEAARQRAVASMQQTLRRMLGRDDALRITVSGPPALLRALREALDDDMAARLDPHEDASAAELQARVDDAVVQTRLQEWLREVLGEAPLAVLDGASGNVPAAPSAERPQKPSPEEPT